MRALNGFRSQFRRGTLRADATAGLVLGVESVPDGLAGGLLAGVNPIFGLHGYLFGTFAGGLFTSSSFMAVQATGAMAIIVADVGAVHGNDDPSRALFTLSIVTGALMIAAGVLKLGFLLRFVSRAVTVGFISAVGVNIVLGQLDNLTGYEGQGANRVARAFDHVVNLGETSWATLAVGIATIALIVVLERTRLGPLGMVIGLAVTSGAVVAFGWDVAQLADIAQIPRGLPAPMLPELRLIPTLLIPAASLVFVGLVQGSAISTGFPNPDGTYPDASRDFIGQGAGNLAAGLFQGMPVGGSMSASSLVKTAGARSRAALLIAGLVMAIVIVAFAPVVDHVAMSALAGLLVVVGVRTVKPTEIRAVWRTGSVQAVVMTVTFVLTMVIPLQYAVLVGVGISMILFIVSRSNRVTVAQWVVDESGNLRETGPPEFVPADQVLVLQPYGSLFFASAQVFEQALPVIAPTSTNAVVIVRLRGFEDLGSTLMEVLRRYHAALTAVGSKLVLVSASDRVLDQLHAANLVEVIGATNIYPADEWLGATLRRAHQDAEQWIDTGYRGGSDPGPPST